MTTKVEYLEYANRRLDDLYVFDSDIRRFRQVSNIHDTHSRIVKGAMLGQSFTPNEAWKIVVAMLMDKSIILAGG